MKNLYIIGAGGFGREVEEWVSHIPYNQRDWELKGYLNSIPDSLDKYPTNYKVLADSINYSFTSKDMCILAIADVYAKQKLYNILKDKVEFMTFISPKAIVGKFNKIGKGSVIAPNVIITTNVEIGECVTVNIGTQIGHDVTIGSYSSLMAQVNIGGGCIVEEQVFMGTNSTIIPKRIIKRNSRIGAGSVVISNVKENITVFGNPAKKI